MQIAAIVVFRLLLGRLKLPLIIREVSLGAFYCAILFGMLTRLGANVTGLVATSTVATAIIGLSLQEILLNIVGGIVVQMEGEIVHGDFVVTKDHGAGWVRTVRTRYTTLETSDRDLILVPNNVLIKNSVTVVSKIHRRLVPFFVSYEHSPAVICETVEKALNAAPLFGIATDPPPKCIVTEMSPGHIQYAVMIFQDRPGHFHVEVSDVLTRVHFALTRAGYPLVGVPVNLEVLQVEQYPRPMVENIGLRIEMLRRSEVFGMLADSELSWLAGRFVRVPFAPGEFVVRQGDEGQSLFLVANGRLRVMLEGSSGRSEAVAELAPGGMFGEMSLLTGARRTASVIAMDMVECNRLDKDDFAKVIQMRPELANQIALVLATRQGQLDDLHTRLNSVVTDQPKDLLARMQAFFQLG